MKKQLLILFIILGTLSHGFSQNYEVQFQAGAAGFRLNFPGFQSYLSTYNKEYADNDMMDSAKFNPYGAGIHLGGIFRMGAFIAGLNIGQINGFQTKATFSRNESRNFNFRTNYFDVQLGARIGNNQSALIPYFNMTIGTLHLYSSYNYGDLRSYGGEKNLNGVYTSWRLYGMAGARYVHQVGKKLSLFLDWSIVLNQQQYGGGEFTESNSATDSKYFKAYETQPEVDAITDGLKETYRMMRGVVGIQFNVWSNE